MNISKKVWIFDISVFISMVLAIFIYSTFSFQAGCENIKDSVLRLHVIANSDSEQDQELKLRVRDRLLETGALVFAECRTKDEAGRLAESRSAYLKEQAERVIAEEGYDYEAEVSVSREYYPTREYEGATLPAGEYLSLRVVIGEGKGRNWWCVMFPPMCLSAATDSSELETVLNSEGRRVVSSDPGYEVRFRIVEWWEELKVAVRSR